MFNIDSFFLNRKCFFLKIALLKLLIASHVSDVTKGPLIIYLRDCYISSTLFYLFSQSNKLVREVE